MKALNLCLIMVALLMFVILPASAVTLSENVRFNESMKLNEERSFNIILSPDLNEKPVVFNNINVEGSCSEWIIIDKAPLTIDRKITIPVKVKVPNNATNNAYRCDITMTTPKSGITQLQLGFPITIKVNGALTPLTTTTIPTQKPEVKITTQPTIKEPAVQTTVQPVQQTQSTPSLSAIIFISLAILGLMLLIVAIGVVVFNRD